MGKVIKITFNVYIDIKRQYGKNFNMEPARWLNEKIH